MEARKPGFWWGHNTFCVCLRPIHLSGPMCFYMATWSLWIGYSLILYFFVLTCKNVRHILKHFFIVTYLYYWLLFPLNHKQFRSSLWANGHNCKSGPLLRNHHAQLVSSTLATLDYFHFLEYSLYLHAHLSLGHWDTDFGVGTWAETDFRVLPETPLPRREELNCDAFTPEDLTNLTGAL